MVPPGWEAVYTGDKSETITDSTDKNGNVIEKWSTWGTLFEGKAWNDWDEEIGFISKVDQEIRFISKMQEALGPLDDNTRQIRAHIGSLVPCDSGLPVTIDELLKAISQGQLSEPSFRNGCWYGGMWWELKSTQPGHHESMQAICSVVTGYLAGRPEVDLLREYPHATGFINRAYRWLGPTASLTQLQKLLMERMLLPFEFFMKASHTDPRSSWPEGAEEACDAAVRNCYAEDGRGAEIDAEIAESEGLPEISMMYPDQARKAQIKDSRKMQLYILCCSLAHGLHTLSDCHHSTFRWIENWVHAIGTGRWGIPTREAGTEKERLGYMLFGYLLGLDKWLLGKPMQYLLLDLGYVDLGFDPKNEVVRVYAYLGDNRTPVMQWLAACLWHNLMSNVGGLLWQNKHNDLIYHAREHGISVSEWMNASPKGTSNSR